jgi:hypothetical protein
LADTEPIVASAAGAASFRLDPAVLDGDRIRTEAVVRRALDDEILASGEVVPAVDGEAYVGAMISGRVAGVLVKAGEAVTQYMREWSRISREAVENRFSLPLLGSAMIRQLKAFDYVKSVEIMFVTSSNPDVLELKQTGDRFIRIINAMTRMAEDHDFDCETCEFQPVCNEAEELRRMHKALKEKQTV